MKKFFAVFLACLILVSFVGGAFAEEGNVLTDSKKYELFQKFLERKPEFADRLQKLQEKMENGGNGQMRFEAMKEFKDEIHRINELRMERNTLRNQVIGKQDTILDLYIVAREAGNNEEALQAVKGVRHQIKDINREIGNIAKTIRDERKAFREEVKNGNTEAAREHVNNVITYQTMINEKIKAKIDLLSNIVDILS